MIRRYRIKLIWPMLALLMYLAFLSCAAGPVEMATDQFEQDTIKNEITELLKIAKIQFDGWQLQSADQTYDKAIEKLSQNYPPNHLFVGKALYNRAELNRLLGRYDLAEKLFKQAFAIQSKNKSTPPHQIYMTYRGLCLLYQDIGRFSMAENLYDELLLLQIEKHGKFNHWYAQTLRYIADKDMAKGNYKEAKQHYRETLEIQRQLTAKQTGLYAIALNNYASLELRLGNYPVAESLYVDAIEITESYLGKKHHEYARTLTNLGYLNLYQGKYSQSEKRCVEALAILENYYGRLHPDIAITLDHLAQLNALRGKYGRAEQLYLQSSAILQKIYGSDHKEFAVSLNNLGQFYLKMGDHKRAEIMLNRALNVADTTLESEHPQVLAIRYNIGLLRYYQNNYDAAVREFKYVTIKQQSIYGNRSVHVALTKSSLGRAYRGLAKYDAAEALLHQALSIQETHLGENHLRVAFTLNSLASVYKEKGDFNLTNKEPSKAEMAYRRSHSSYLRALAVAAILNNPELLWRTQHGMSSLLESRNKPNAAIFAGKQAVNTIQTMRREIALMDPSLQEKFISSKEHVYRSLAAKLIVVGRLPEAEHVISFLKKYEYKKLMIPAQERGSSPLARVACDGDEDEYCERFQEICDDLVEIAKEFKKLAKKKNLNPEEKTRYEKLSHDLTAANIVFARYYNRIITSLEERKKFAAIEDHEILYKTEMKPALAQTGGGAVWLNYLVSPNRLHIIITTADKPQTAREIEISSKELNGLVENFRTSITDKEAASDEFYHLARTLYSYIIEPVKKFIRTEATNLPAVRLIVFSFDQGLRYLPVAALHNGDSFLIEDYAIALFTPAAKAKMTDRATEEWQAGGLGISKPATVMAPDSTDEPTVFGALPGVLKELNSIIRDNEDDLEGVMQGENYLDEKFTLDTLGKVLEDKSKHVVHIATHFKFQPGQERKSYLVLGGRKVLTLEYINSMPTIVISKELVTLSACDTGVVAKTGSGSEIEGLGVTLQNKGAKSVLATLWKVNDESTASFMQKFYELRHGAGRISKAEALRQAQQAFIHHPEKPKHRRPYHWAPFILMGNWF